MFETEEKGILDELNQNQPQKGKLFAILLLCSLSYILFVVFDMVIDINRFTLKPFEWDIGVIILILPVTGLIFVLMSKRIGWIISLFYYLVIFVAVFSTVLETLLDTEGDIVLQSTAWRGYLILLLSAFSIVCFLLKSTRKYFRINNWLLGITLCVSVTAALSLYFLLITEQS